MKQIKRNYKQIKNITKTHFADSKLHIVTDVTF